MKKLLDFVAKLILFAFIIAVVGGFLCLLVMMFSIPIRDLGWIAGIAVGVSPFAVVAIFIWAADRTFPNK